MRIPRIHTGQALEAESTFDLEPGPSQHIARALRMQPGDELLLFDGRGGEFPAIITAVDKKRVTVSCQQRVDREIESPLSIHLGIALSRGERMEWVIQKATELGVSEISPLFTERTEVKLSGDRADKKLRHWRQITVSACEQCGRNILPQVYSPGPLTLWLGETEAECKLVLHHRADPVDQAEIKPSTLALLIGPEGGLSPNEIQAAERAGYRSLQLGPRVLRTETAPLAAIAILQARWGDMIA